MKLAIAVLMSLGWGLILSAGACGVSLLVSQPLHGLLFRDQWGSSTKSTIGDLWVDLAVGLGAAIVYGAAAWLGWWLTSPSTHRDNLMPRLAMLLGASPGLLLAFAWLTLQTSAWKGPA